MKGSAIARIIIWSVVVVLLVGILVTALVFDGFGFSGISFNKFNNYDETGYKIGNTEFDSEITAIDINWTSGSANIQVWDKDEYKVTEEYNGDKEADRLRWKISGGTLYIQFRKSGYFNFRRIDDKNLTIYIPEKYAAALRKCEIDSASAQVTVKDIESKIIDIDTASGDIRIQNCKADSLDIDSASGSQTISGEYRKVDFDAASGRLDFSGTVTDLSSSRASGSVKLTIDNAPDKIDIDSASGDVSIIFNSEIPGFTLDYDKASGDLSCGYVTPVYGDGSIKINVDTASGDLSIYPAGKK